MKRIITLAIICLSVCQLIAQNLPQGIAYQAVAVKDGPYSIAGQNPQAIYWSNKDISVRFTIYEKYPGGTNQYSETHATKTDDYGVFNLIIGQGNVISGDFAKIPWDLGTAHLQVEIDFDNNGTYKLTSLERFWSVPYAFVTRKSSSTSTDSALNVLNNKFNYLKNRDKDTVIGNEGGVSYKTLDSLNKVLVAKLAALKSSDKDTVIGNEWQKLTRNKDTLMLSDGGGKVTLLDEDPKNELQELFLRNDSLFITKSIKGIKIKSSNSGLDSTATANSIMFLQNEGSLKKLCSTLPSVANYSTGSLLYKDSIYWIADYFKSQSSCLDVYAISVTAQSKFNCNYKTTYQSDLVSSQDKKCFPTKAWDFYTIPFIGYGNTLATCSKNEGFCEIDVTTYKLTTTKTRFPSKTKSLDYFSKAGIHQFYVYRDTAYIFSRFVNSSASYTSFFKYVISSGDLIFVDSTNNSLFFDPNKNGYAQFEDSLAFVWDLNKTNVHVINLFNFKIQKSFDMSNLSVSNTYYDNWRVFSTNTIGIISSANELKYFNSITGNYLNSVNYKLQNGLTGLYNRTQHIQKINSNTYYRDGVVYSNPVFKYLK